MRVQQRSGFVQYNGPFGVRPVLPGLIALLSACKRILQLRSGQLLKALEQLAVIGVDALIGHVDSFFLLRIVVASKATTRLIVTKRTAFDR